MAEKDTDIMKIKYLHVTKKNAKAIQNLVHVTKEMLCPLLKNGKLHVTKDILANVTGKNFFKMIVKRFNVELDFTKANEYKVACFDKNHHLKIYINANDSLKKQKFYLAHMIGHLELSWNYFPNTANKHAMHPENAKVIQKSNGLVQICGDIGFYNFPENELDANYFAEKLLGYDLY